ncbi:MAG: type II toxin-antitoxin system prevent-host-death family antitoxin [Acidobacteriota bacterium]|nr:type II toxin-antitoxin system prevent-host-death family antitoxin [Acidobacteriota bacterium]
MVTVHEAKTNLSRLIERAEHGEEIIIARRKTPVAKLVGLHVAVQARKFGSMRGQARVTNAFFEPLPATELEGWEG